MKKILTSFALIVAAGMILSAQNIPQAAKDKAADLVSKMTLEEKVSMLSGYEDGFHTFPIERLGIPSIRMADGPQGVRNKTISTLYPAGIAAAASFNREAVYNMGKGIGQDARARGVGIMLGPGVNIYRSAHNGRNFEYFGEDPYLASEAAVNYIKGLQSEGVIATIKHFALNNSEYDRHGISSVVDERTANEIYFETFRKAVQEAGVGAVMTSYNMVNGAHAAENPWLIDENLRGKWGFQGLVMSDWTSTYSPLEIMMGGVDLEMPKNYTLRFDELKTMLDNGVITESMIDAKVQRILQTLIAFGLFDRPAKDESVSENNPFSNQAALDLSLEAPVLVKNNGVLPLKSGKRNVTVLIGPEADIMPCGGGSGEVSCFDENKVTIAGGLSALGNKYPCTYLSNPKSNITAIEKAKAVVVAVGFDKKSEKENSDRTFALPKGQDDLILWACEHNPNVVVVVVSGGEVDMSKWIDKVSAVLYAWYDGQSLGTAVAKILSGAVNPSGRLPFTAWGSEEKNPTSPYYQPTMTNLHNATSKGHIARFGRYLYVEYREGVFVGYRGAEHFGIKPLYPFGYGLSYTTFDYSNLAVNPSGDGFDVTFSISNTGKVAGATVPQIYVAPKDSKVLRPVRELKGYEKVFLDKGETKDVTIHLDRHAFASYCTKVHDWKVSEGLYGIQLCSDAETVIDEKEIEL